MLKRRSASFCSDLSGSRAHRRRYWYGPYFPTRVSRAPFHSIFIHQARFSSFLLSFPMHRSRPAERRGLSSIFLVSLEKNASSFFKLRPVVNHHHRANGSAVSSPKLKQKAWPLQTPMLVENREILRIYINKCTWSCIRLTTDFIQALRCMNIYSRSVFFLSADTQIAPVIQHTLNAALYIQPEKSGLGGLKTRPATTPCVCWHMLFGQCQKENAKREINYEDYIRQSQFVLNIASCFRTCTTCERDGVVQKAFAKRPRLNEPIGVQQFM